MTEIANTKIVKSVLGRWYPGDLAFVEYLEYSTIFQKADSTLKLVGLFQRRDTPQKGWPALNGKFYRVHLLFTGVKNLCISDFGTGPKQILGFDIIDVSDREWEDVKFEIEDYENDQIGFLCNAVEILLVEEMKN